MRRVRIHPAVSSVIVALGTLVAEPVLAQKPSRFSEPPPGVKHLVGHEEIELLNRVDDVLGDWDPRTLRDPYLDTLPGFTDGRPADRKVVRRSDLLEFIADARAAEALGKALFWEIQAGSDFQRTADGRFVGTACASCHYRFGADARDRYTDRIPYVAWNRYAADPKHPLQQYPFDVTAAATRDFKITDQSTPWELIVGSVGVEPRIYEGLNSRPDAEGPWVSERSRPHNPLVKPAPEWAMFVSPRQSFRQMTSRNSPSVINSGFSDRLFHDGRAESTFNGFSIFGDRDRRKVLYRRDRLGRLLEVDVAVTNAALASQAVGPIVNDVEMSYTGRTFPIVARKLLDAPVLGYQEVDQDDSVLGWYARRGLVGQGAPSDRRLTYRALIQRAFRREWWDGQGGDGKPQHVPLELSRQQPGGMVEMGPLDEANFSLFWGLALMVYQGSLVSNESPFDAMLRGDGAPVNAAWEANKAQIGPVHLDVATLPASMRPPGDPTPRPELKTGTEVFQRGQRVFRSRGCIECHSGPFLSVVYDRLTPFEPSEPIYRVLSNLLFPNAQADAIGLNYQKFERDTLQQVAALLRPRQALWKLRVASYAIQLNQLRSIARGDLWALTQLVAVRGAQLPIALPTAIRVAGLLMNYEKNAPTRAGGRPFFDENQRVDLAQKLTKKVLVEWSPLPPSILPFRPRLPISGALATPPYAFYDLGFYNLGVAPPRYDRGIGGLQSIDRPIDLATEAAFDALLKQAPAEDDAPELLAARAEVGRLNSEQLQSLKAGLIRGGDLGGLPLTELAQQTLLSCFQDRFQQMNQKQQAVQEPTLRARGQAYRFDPMWQRPPRNQAEPKAQVAAEAPDGAARAALPEAVITEDRSWDRNYLPQNQRRSEQNFMARVRDLVLNEENWGHRKPFLHDNELDFWGAFKAPPLRNVELTAPYMHNGRLLTLRDVIEFYDDGGHVPISRDDNPDKNPAMVPLDLTEDDKRALHFWMICLTDDRVRYERAPFDHPSLPLINGYQANAPDASLAERLVQIPAVGQHGRQKPPASFPASD